MVTNHPQRDHRTTHVHFDLLPHDSSGLDNTLPGVNRQSAFTTLETPRYIDCTGNPVIASSSPRNHRNAGVRLNPELFKPLCLPSPEVSPSMYSADDKTCDSERVPPEEQLSLDSLEPLCLPPPLISPSTYSVEGNTHNNESLQAQEGHRLDSVELLRLPTPLLRSVSASSAEDASHESEQVQLQERSGSDYPESLRLAHRCCHQHQHEMRSHTTTSNPRTA